MYLSSMHKLFGHKMSLISLEYADPISRKNITKKYMNNQAIVLYVTEDLAQ